MHAQILYGMAKAHFQGVFGNDKYNINVGLTLYFWKEDDFYFVYSPALDLTGYGKSEEDAKSSFEITLGEFVKYTANKKTIYDELEALGWTVNRKKNRVHAPDTNELLADNEEFQHILSKGGVKFKNTNVELALAV